jgi:hypothetical protein
VQAPNEKQHAGIVSHHVLLFRCCFLFLQLSQLHEQAALYDFIRDVALRHQPPIGYAVGCTAAGSRSRGRSVNRAEHSSCSFVVLSGA